MRKPRIGDDADDGAEQGCDQQAARAVMGLLGLLGLTHGADYAGHGTGDQIAVDSKTPLFARLTGL